MRSSESERTRRPPTIETSEKFTEQHAEQPERGEVQPAPKPPAGDALQAWLCLLPALVLVWPGPGSILRDDFVPQSTGVGAAAVLSIPAACLLVLRRAAPVVRGLTLYLVPLLIGVGWITFGGVSDTFEAGRVLLCEFTGLVMLLSGASLGERGRRILARGAVFIALALLVPAHLDRENGWSGVLGNTGSVSEAALAGALIGAVFLTRESLAWRIAGGAALLLEVAFTARVPVIAGAVALAVVLGATALLARAVSRAWRIAFASFACAALLTLLPSLHRAGSSETEVERGAQVDARSDGASKPMRPATAQSPEPGNTGGIEVRARIWWASLHLLRDHALLGVGPGQFIASFPAYRDPREIELTTLGRRLGGETEVEHPHNDYLATSLDVGIVGGLCWIAFLITILLRSVRGLVGADFTRFAVAAGAMGFCANAFVNATLTGNAVSSTLAFAIFGCVLGGAGSERTVLVRRFVTLCAATLLAVHAPRALAFLRHGRAMHPLAAATAPDTDKQARVLDTALEACPDSVLALRLHARLMEGLHRDPALIHAEWLRVLSARPQHIEALMQLGLLAAVAGEPAQARPYYRMALELDSEHPGVLQNLVVLEFEDGDAQAGLDYLERLSRLRPPTTEWLADLASRLYLRGQERESNTLIERVDPGLANLGAEESYARSKEERLKQRTLLADALESRAQRTWARDHMRAGRYKDAVRLYRQDLRITRDYIGGGAPRLRMELTAALLAAGREDEAKTEAAELHPKPSDWEAMPSFASERLKATAWFPK